MSEIIALLLQYQQHNFNDANVSLKRSETCFADILWSPFRNSTATFAFSALHSGISDKVLTRETI